MQSTPSPYRGLVPYEERDWQFFFGREAETKIIVANLISTRVTVLYGASGVGKSSILRAGVAHSLRTQAERDLSDTGAAELAVVIFSNWRDEPVSALLQEVGTVLGKLHRGEPRPQETSTLSQTLRIFSDHLTSGLLIVLDQFEEYFLYHEQQDDPFLPELAVAANTRELRANFLISIREDALAKLDCLKKRIPSIYDNCLRLQHLDIEAGREAIEGPIHRYNGLHRSGRRIVKMDPELVSVVLSQVKTGQVALTEASRVVSPENRSSAEPIARIETPYLQLVMMKLWDEDIRDGSGTLRVTTLGRLGGAEEIVRTHLDSGMRSLTLNEQLIAKRVFDYLVTPSGMKIAHRAADLAKYLTRDRARPADNLREQLPTILDKLCGASLRILRNVTPAEEQDQPRYEIFHDVLAPAILDWCARYEARLQRARVRAEAQRALEQERQKAIAQRQRDEEERLVQQRELEVVRTLAETQRQRADAEREARRKQRSLIIALVGLLLLSGLSAAFAGFQWISAHVAEKRTSEVASQANVSLAHYSTEVGNDAEALAHLAEALRLDPRNAGAVALTGTILDQNSWPFPVGGLMRHNYPVRSVQFSPDGKRVVTASLDYTARLWDGVTGQQIGEPMQHQGWVYSAQFSPDGRQVVTASADYTARLWDGATGQQIGEPMQHQGWVYHASFSPDGQRVVTASADKTARLWDGATGKQIGVPMKHEAEVNYAQFSPDGRLVVTASDDKTARLWNAVTGERIGEPMKHEAAVLFAQFSPDGQRVVTASLDKTARLWNAVTGERIGEPMKHEAAVFFAQFSPDGQRAVTASLDKTARLWDGATGKQIGVPMKHEGEVYSAQFSPDGQRVVTASADKTARLWDGATGKQIGEPVKHEGGVNSAQFSPDGQRVVSASDDNTARFWDVVTGERIGESMKHEAEVKSAQFSPDGQRVATSSTDTTARLWDAATGEKIGDPIKHEGWVFFAWFSPDGQRIVTASSDNTARLWDASTGKQIGEPMTHQGTVNSAQFSPDGQRVVTTSKDFTARLWYAATGKQIGEPIKHKNQVNSAEFSPDGQRIVTASGDTTAGLWDAATGKQIGELMQHEDPVLFAQFSPDGQRVVTASADKTARLWDGATGKPIGEPMKHEGGVLFAQFSPDGQRVVTASADKTARLWDGATGKQIGVPMKHEGVVNTARFSPDGRLVVTASDDKTARLWDGATGKQIGEPMQHEGQVNSAQFSPDGQRLVTASDDNTARLWDVPAISGKYTSDDVLLLADLAEATGCAGLQTSGQTEMLSLRNPDQVRATRAKVAAMFAGPSSGLTPLQRLMKWSVSERKSRTISPFSDLTVAEWIENRIVKGTQDELRSAIKVDPANGRLAAYFGRRLADHALKDGLDADEARRAKGEADFQTCRAVKLAPDNDEIKKLRAEVVKLLKLNSECQ